jgi:hypothetical protein
LSPHFEKLRENQFSHFAIHNKYTVLRTLCQ